MNKLPPPPPEIPADTDMLKLAPVFAAKVFALLHNMNTAGHDAIMAEGFRSDERQSYLWKFGREYDDGRGVVTQSPTGAKSWHRYGLAVDVISKSKQWDAPQKFWDDLEDCALALGLTSGASWTFKDKPHVQHWCPGMHVTPSDHAWELLQSQGVEAVWKELHANDYEPPRAA